MTDPEPIEVDFVGLQNEYDLDVPWSTIYIRFRDVVSRQLIALRVMRSRAEGLVERSNLSEIYEIIRDHGNPSSGDMVSTHATFYRTGERVDRITFRLPEVEGDEEGVEVPRPESLDDVLNRILPTLESRSDEPARRMACVVRKILDLGSTLNDEYLTRSHVLQLYQQPANPSSIAPHLRRELERYLSTIRDRPIPEKNQLLVDWLIDTDANIFAGYHEIRDLYGRGEARFLAEWLRQRQANPDSIYHCYGAPS